MHTVRMVHVSLHAGVLVNMLLILVLDSFWCLLVDYILVQVVLLVLAGADC